jgi:NACalpha-BTF3-like transcription factor
MKRISLILFIAILLSSCNLFKTVTRQKGKQKTHTVERGIITYKAPRQEIVYLPNIKVKDTDLVIRKPRVIMTVKKRQNSIKQVSCEAPEIDVKKRYEKETDQKIKVAASQANGLQLKAYYIFYVFIGLAFLIIANNLTKRK